MLHPKKSEFSSPPWSPTPKRAVFQRLFRYASRSGQHAKLEQIAFNFVFPHPSLIPLMRDTPKKDVPRPRFPDIDDEDDDECDSPSNPDTTKSINDAASDTSTTISNDRDWYEADEVASDSDSSYSEGYNDGFASDEHSPLPSPVLTPPICPWAHPVSADDPSSPDISMPRRKLPGRPGRNVGRQAYGKVGSLSAHLGSSPLRQEQLVNQR
ncbi:hypothetical protein L198_03706 [Cryptococcus wingfieldii CBS 7118]|uniref:Uncharacterized protein n=1 Tax=Cryptococcus wingfieldii CBS 7118 TaxID=1295528 RepID=A0A1E3JEX5_9TREE|nr:hypothetical protein L198_03706 [Cryptococcus wingfieldii CBS 7118]ODN98461.1 hypothetical protein L198_03706 [Cryptococcus wingfieldii CBS 7118]